ncbi:MAG TPA: nickel pincer cofactor biosynthesis protein LarC [Terriglobales bacterium]|nr:nickel pincer cofactor biosynthesis protein LarC [Terriglobales bacterium]
MRIAYLNCFSGISGDMFLGALVDAGVSPGLLRQTVQALKVGAELEIARTLRNGFAATKVDVIVNGEKDLPREEFWEKQHAHSHEHEHSHEHPNQHSHGAAHPNSHDHRSLKEIRQIISAAMIPESAKTLAVKIFETLGAAEAKIHGKDLESIHFHEVGSADAIVDIVCAAVGAESLGVDEWRSSALNVGGGVVHCAHGTLPVPAPAVVEMLRDAPVYSSGAQKELVTPTGAAIVRTLVKSFGEFPVMKIRASGFGAGARDLPGQANVLRLTVGESVTTPVEESPEGDQTVTVLEATIDDMTPQVFGYVLEKLLQNGALDAFGLPVQMKKSRPGMLLTVLARNEDTQHLTDVIFSETTTIGLRTRREQRITLPREWVPVETRWGTVRIKLAHLHGEETNAAPEFEDCRRIAEEHRVPLKTVMQDAMRAYLEQKEAAGTK